VARQVPSLLLLRLDGIGDNVCSWPALKLLRENLPGTRIAIAVGPWAAPLYRECPWVDEVIEWDSGLFGLFRGRGLGGLWRDLKLTGTLRERGFAAGIDLRGDLLSIALLRLVAPPARVATVTRGGRRLLSDPLQLPDGHETQRAYDIACATLGLPVGQVPRLQDWSRPDALTRARGQLVRSGWNESIPAVALCPPALWPWKQWPKERFRELAERLKQEHSLQVVWFLEEKTRAADYTTDDPVFCGPLDEVAAALGLCRLAVSNDSGLMHIAVAAGCKTVQLFGPGDASRFAHRGSGTVLFHDTSCRFYPCTRSGRCSNLAEGWCLEKIGVDEVLASCIRLLEAECSS
jgi:heptosyltransferase-2